MGKSSTYMFVSFIIGVSLYCWICNINVYGYGYSDTTDYINRFLYMFYHSNILHLAFNCIAVFSLIEAISNETIFGRWFIILSSVVIGFLGTFGSECELPTIGMSGVAFALIGMRTYYYRNRLWVIVVIETLLLQIIVPFFTSINVQVHSLCFIYGIGLMFIISKVKLYLKRKRNEKSGVIC